MEEQAGPPVEEGSVEAAAQALLARQQARREEAAKAKEPVEDNPEPTDEQPDVEATPEAETEDGEAPETTDEETQEPPTYTVKIGGEEVAVTLEELRSGYMKDADYRRKTAEVAELRKAAEVERETAKGLSEAKAQLAKELEILAELNSRLPYTDEQLSKLRETDATQYLLAERENERRKGALQEVRQRIAAVQGEISEERKAEEAKRVLQERELLLKAVPELAKPDHKNRLIDYLKSSGATDEEITRTVDHRVFLLAEKARRYDEMMAKAKDNKPKVVTPKVVTPGARPVAENPVEKRLKEAAAQAKKSGSVEAWAEYLRVKSTATQKKR